MADGIHLKKARKRGWRHTEPRRASLPRGSWPSRWRRPRRVSTTVCALTDVRFIGAGVLPASPPKVIFMTGYKVGACVASIWVPADVQPAGTAEWSPLVVDSVTDSGGTAATVTQVLLTAALPEN